MIRCRIATIGSNTEPSVSDKAPGSIIAAARFGPELVAVLVAAAIFVLYAFVRPATSHDPTSPT